MYTRDGKSFPLFNSREGGMQQNRPSPSTNSTKSSSQRSVFEMGFINEPWLFKAIRKLEEQINGNTGLKPFLTSLYLDSNAKITTDLAAGQFLRTLARADPLVISR